MIILVKSTDSLQVNLAGDIATNQLQCISFWRDTTVTDYTPGRTLANTNNATNVDISESPSESHQIIIDYVSIYNNDTINHILTVKFSDSGTEYILWKGILAPGEKLEYSDKLGFQVFSNVGAAKISSVVGNNPATSVIQSIILGADVISNAIANTIADVTGLSFPVTANKLYWFRFVINYRSAATSTGSRWSISAPNSPTLLSYTSRYTLTANTETLNYATAYDMPTTSNASSLTAGNVAVIEGFMIPSSSGILTARFASEILNSAITAKAGSILQYQQLT